MKISDNFKNLFNSLFLNDHLTNIEETIILIPKNANSSSLKKALCEVGSFNVTVNSIDYFCEKVAATSSKISKYTKYSYLDRFYCVKKILKQNSLSTTVSTVNEFLDLFSKLENDPSLLSKLNNKLNKLYDIYKNELPDTLTYNIILECAVDIYNNIENKKNNIYYLMPEYYSFLETEFLKSSNANLVIEPYAFDKESIPYSVFDNPYEEVWSIFNMLLKDVKNTNSFLNNAIVYSDQSYYKDIIEVIADFNSIPIQKTDATFTELLNFFNLNYYRFDVRSFIDILPLLEDKLSEYNISADSVIEILYSLGYTMCNLRNIIFNIKDENTKNFFEDISTILKSISSNSNSLSTWSKITNEISNLISREYDITQLSIIDNSHSIEKDEWIFFLKSFIKNEEDTPGLSVLKPFEVFSMAFNNVYFLGCDQNSNFDLSTSNILLNGIETSEKINFFTNNLFLSYSKQDPKGNKNFLTTFFSNAYLEDPNPIITTHEKYIPKNLADITLRNISKYLDDKNDNKKHFSASAAQSALNCPLKYNFANYIENDPTWKDEPIAKDYGKLIHDSLDRLVKDKLTKEEILDSILNNKLFKNNLSTERTKQILENFYNTQSILDTIYKPIEIKTEYEFEAEIAGINTKGKIDRIDIAKNEIYIYDYKTGQTYYETKKLDPKTALDSLQNNLYAYIVKHFLAKDLLNSNDNIQIYTAYWNLDSPMGIKNSSPLLFTEEDEEYFLDIFKLANIVKTKKILTPRKSIKCQYCPISHICPNDKELLWEIAIENDETIKNISDKVKVNDYQN